MAAHQDDPFKNPRYDANISASKRKKTEDDYSFQIISIDDSSSEGGESEKKLLQTAEFRKEDINDDIICISEPINDSVSEGPSPFINEGESKLPVIQEESSQSVKNHQLQESYNPYDPPIYGAVSGETKMDIDGFPFMHPDISTKEVEAPLNESSASKPESDPPLFLELPEPLH